MTVRTRLVLMDEKGAFKDRRKEAVLSHLGVHLLYGSETPLEFGLPPDDVKFSLTYKEMDVLVGWWNSLKTTADLSEGYKEQEPPDMSKLTYGVKR